MVYVKSSLFILVSIFKSCSFETCGKMMALENTSSQSATPGFKLYSSPWYYMANLYYNDYNPSIKTKTQNTSNIYS